MNSIYASEKIKQVIWPDFIAHFKSSSSIASYHADIAEILEILKKDFLQINSHDVKTYFDFLQKKVSAREIQPGTMAKKICELHSFAEFICENKEKYQVNDMFNDFFYPYLKYVGKQKKLVNSVPVEHIDKIFKAAEDNLMAYCILALLHRAGLSSTEITELHPENLTAYDNGVYANIAGRKNPCFIPEDVFVVLEKYMVERLDYPYFFYNNRGNKLNTMYISRMMKKYTAKAGVPSYSAEALRNVCAVTMFAYGASPEQVASQMGITQMQIKRYNNISYRENLAREANYLVKIKVEPPKVY